MTQASQECLDRLVVTRAARVPREPQDLQEALARLVLQEPGLTGPRDLRVPLALGSQEPLVKLDKLDQLVRAAATRASLVKRAALVLRALPELGLTEPRDLREPLVRRALPERELTEPPDLREPRVLLV